MGLSRRAVRWTSAVLTGLALSAVVAGCVLAESALHVPRSSVRIGPERVAAIRPLASEWRTVSLQARDGVPLAAWYLRPAAGNGTCVIVLHGIGDSRAGSLGFAPMFLARGYTVLLPDSRGHGESGGDLVTYGVREKWDVLAWAEWLRGAGCRSIAGFGESLGAGILLEAAAERPVFSAVVAECPFASLRWIGEDRVMQRLRGPDALKRIVARVVVESAMLYAHARYGLDLNSAAPLEAARHIRVPVLLIHGLRDTSIAPAHSRAIAGSNPGASLWLVPGAAHTAASAADPAGFKRRVLGWF